MLFSEYALDTLDDFCLGFCCNGREIMEGLSDSVFGNCKEAVDVVNALFSLFKLFPLYISVRVAITKKNPKGCNDNLIELNFS